MCQETVCLPLQQHHWPVFSQSFSVQFLLRLQKSWPISAAAVLFHLFNPNLSHMLHSKVSSNENRNRRRKKQSEGIKDGEKQGATSQRDMRHEKKRPTEREREVKTLCTPMGDTCLCTQICALIVCPAPKTRKSCCDLAQISDWETASLQLTTTKLKYCVCVFVWVSGWSIHPPNRANYRHTHTLLVIHGLHPSVLH